MTIIQWWAVYGYDKGASLTYGSKKRGSETEEMQEACGDLEMRLPNNQKVTITNTEPCGCIRYGIESAIKMTKERSRGTRSVGNEVAENSKER